MMMMMMDATSLRGGYQGILTTCMAILSLVLLSGQSVSSLGIHPHTRRFQSTTTTTTTTLLRQHRQNQQLLLQQRRLILTTFQPLISSTQQSLKVAADDESSSGSGSGNNSEENNRFLGNTGSSSSSSSSSSSPSSSSSSSRMPPEERINIGDDYQGSVDWDAEWKKVVANNNQPKERPGKTFYKSEAEIAAIKAVNKAQREAARVAANIPPTPTWRSIKGDWKFWVGVLLVISFGSAALSAISTADLVPVSTSQSSSYYI